MSALFRFQKATLLTSPSREQVNFLRKQVALRELSLLSRILVTWQGVGVVGLRPDHSTLASKHLGNSGVTLCIC